MPYKDPEKRKQKDNNYYAVNRLAIVRKAVLRKRRRLQQDMSVEIVKRLHGRGAGKRLLAFPDRRWNGGSARALGWALVLHRTRDFNFDRPCSK